MITIGVLGLGLIGGSVALAAQQAGHTVLGWDVDEATREEAAEQGLSVTSDFSAAAIVILGLPMPDLTGGLAQTLAGLRMSEESTITDVGSLKVPVATAMGSAGLAERYVGGHPMAGTERSGFWAADRTLFSGARWALCLNEEQTDISRWLAVAGLVTQLGAIVLPVTPTEHDKVLGLVSGLPHLLALGLSIAAVRCGPLASELAAGSFADLTRVAGSDPRLLRAVTQENAPAVREAMHLLMEQLERPWMHLVEDGRAARDRLLRGVPKGPPADRIHQVPANIGELVQLGRLGAVVVDVDPDTRSVRYRLPRS